MTAVPIESIERRVFRAGTAFELVLFDRLPPHDQAALLELRKDPDFYGILRPRQANGQTIKSVNKDIALLWLTLQSPGPLPLFVYGDQPEAAASAVWQLVLDGVLETEEAGGFVSGAQAASLFTDGPPSRAPGRLSELSRSALRHAERTRFADSTQLASWLYRFGSQPITPSWSKRLPDSQAVLGFVGATPGSALRRALDSQWEVASDQVASGWIAWSSRDRARAYVAPGNPTFKLYLSPAIEALPAVFAAALGTMPQRTMSFKIGANAAGLLRPDKMVLYFENQESLLAVGSELSARCAQEPAQGVPFSAQISDGGLLSWGIDPPQRERHLAWQGVESWRLWVARRLAAAMMSAQSGSGGPMSSADFALERLRHEGVDVDDWTPAARLWRTP